MRLEGIIRKWVSEGHWGIVHSYTNRTNGPEKFFVHINKAPVGAVLDLGVRISFEPGQPRRKGDLPAAVKIRLCLFGPIPASVDSSNGGAK